MQGCLAATQRNAVATVFQIATYDHTKKLLKQSRFKYLQLLSFQNYKTNVMSDKCFQFLYTQKTKLQNETGLKMHRHCMRFVRSVPGLLALF